MSQCAAAMAAESELVRFDRGGGVSGNFGKLLHPLRGVTGAA
jgi:hypothetical protein